MESTIEVPVYRAITGRGKFVDKNWVFEGVSDQELGQRGILCNNFSFVQFDSSHSNNPIDRRVYGLPIFLNFDEAVHWIEGKKNETVPAIVESKIPISVLYGDSRKVRLVRNGLEERDDYEPTEEELMAHLKGDKLIRGESFLQGTNGTGLDEILRSHETIYRPNTMQDGKVYVADGFSVAEPTQK